MDLIKSLIALLSPTEQQLFINNLKKNNKRKDAKNILLFQLYKKGEAEKLKLQMGANSFGVLKKRLTDRLEEFTANAVILREQTTAIEIMKQLVLSRKLLEHKSYKYGFKLLLNAEKRAITFNNFHLLNEIYETLIAYSYHELSPDQEILFESAEKNSILYENQRKLTMVYAVIRRFFFNKERDNTNNTNNNVFDIEEITNKSFQKFGISDELGYSFQSLYQIAEIADIEGAITKNYFEVDLFFEKRVALLKGGPLDTESQLIYHIDLLYLIAHIYFRKKIFGKSIFFLAEMEDQMARYNGLYYPIKEVKRTTLLALNNNYTGNYKFAAEILDELLTRKINIQLKNKELLQASLTRIMIHFQQNELELAKSRMAELRYRDKYYIDTAGLEWLLNKKIMEILLHIELGNTDLVDAQIASLMRKKTAYFSAENEQGLPFLLLIRQYHQNPHETINTAFKEKVENSFHWKPVAQEDLFFISFYAWLKSKMTNESLYKTTLNLINGI